MEKETLDRYLNDEDYTLLKEYLSVFDRYCYNNPFVGVLTFLLVMGQLFKNKKIPKGDGFFDLRVHVLLIQPSGSGKSEALNFVEQLCEKLKLKVFSSTDYTDAGLIGGVDPKPKSKKKNETLDESEQNEEENNNDAALNVADILSMDEASVLFKDNTPFALHARVYLQKAMNYYESKSNHILRLLRDGKIDFYPHASIWLTTVMPKEFDGIVSSGFLQRMLINIEDEDIEKRKSNAIEDINRIDFTNPYHHKGYSEHSSRIERLASKLDQLKDYHDLTNLDVPESHRELIREICKEMFELIKTIPGQEKINKVASFGTRYMIQIYKVAYLLAMSRRSKVMLEKDVLFAAQIVGYCLKNLILYLENKAESTGNSREAKMNRIYMLIEEAGKSGIQAEKLRQKVLGKVCGQSTLYELLPLMEKKKMIKKEQIVREGHAYVYYKALDYKAGL
jgi:hypothetical protein